MKLVKNFVKLEGHTTLPPLTETFWWENWPIDQIELQILSYDEEVKFMDIWFYPTVEASERTLQPSNGIAAAASSSSIL